MGLWRNEQPFSSHLLVEKGAKDWELWFKKKKKRERERIKQKGEKMESSFILSSLEAFCLNEERQESIDVKWLKRPGRGRKVEEGTPATVYVITPSLCTLPNPLLNFPCRSSQWQKFKWVKSKPAEAHCLRELWWKSKIKRCQFWNMVKDAAACWM